MKPLNHQQTGFTLVELAIVLVVIGLILGMAFKGKDLIDSAKVKSLAAQYNKILAATNIFYEKYGFYPGDGCPANATSPSACTNTKNGYVDGGNGSAEVTAFWSLLAATNILQASDRKSIFGQNWDLYGAATTGQLAYGTWLDLPGGAQADPRIVCMWDRMSDDGDPDTGRIITLGAKYTPTTDCWSQTGQYNVHAKILP